MTNAEREELDALDWCRINRASIHFDTGRGEEPYDVTVEAQGHTYAAPTLVDAVKLARE